MTRSAADGTEVGRRSATPPTGYRHRDDCRACGSTALEVILDLGQTPLANHFLTEADLDEPEPTFPLMLSWCRECGLTQLRDAVEPGVLFSDYLYFSSASTPVIDHNQEVAQQLRERYVRTPEDFVCEIGSNDGVFLRHFVGHADVLGVDPAANMVPIAANKGVPTLTRFFNLDTAREIRAEHGRARLIFAANVLAHIDDLGGAVAGVAELLDDEGVLVMEVHRSLDLLGKRHFDQIYHEHLCYWALRPLQVMLARFGLRAFDVGLVATQGQSYQLHAALTGSSHAEQPSVAAVRSEEQRLGLESAGPYEAFAGQVGQTVVQLRELIQRLRGEGSRIVGYGAPAKATTLLSAVGLGRDDLEYIVDSTPAKQGRFMPGSRIPIRAPEILEVDTPDYVLLLAWNYADVILERERPLRERGARFIIPLPEPRIV